MLGHKCLAKLSFLSLIFLLDQNCDARRCEEVQEKRDYPAGSTTAIPTCADSESHPHFNNEEQEQLPEKTDA